MLENLHLSAEIIGKTLKAGAKQDWLLCYFYYPFYWLYNSINYIGEYSELVMKSRWEN